MHQIVSVNLSNPKHDVPVLAQRLQLGRLARTIRPDVIVTQEARPRIGSPVGYRAMPVVVAGAHEDRIIVRKDRRVIAHGYIRLHPGREGLWPARSLPYVAIERGTQPDLWVVGMHLNSKIEHGGEFIATGERRAFTAHAVKATADFARFVHVQLGGRVLVIGDTNVHAYADKRERSPQLPTVRFGAAGLVELLPDRPSGTLGSRRVDRAWLTSGIRGSVRDLARRAPYDHQPIAVRVA